MIVNPYANLTPLPTKRPAAPTPAASTDETAAPRSWKRIGLGCLTAATTLLSGAALARTTPPMSVVSTTSQTADDQAPMFGIGGALLPDSSGKIQHMGFQFGNVEFNKPLPEPTKKALLGVYKTFFQKMDSNTRFTIVTANDEGEAAVRQTVKESGMSHPERVQVINLQAQKGISIWMRDSMFPAEGPNADWKILVQDRTYWPGPEDNRVAQAITANNSDIHLVQHPALRVDGGNVITNEKTAFIGIDSVGQTTARLQELAADDQKKAQIISFYEHQTGRHVITDGQPSQANDVTLQQMWGDIAPEVFKSEFHRQVFIVGQDDPSSPIRLTQPVFHIDMALTPVGEKKVLVGDPSIAIKTLQGLSPREHKRVNEEMARAAGLHPSKDLINDLIEVNSDPAEQANFDNVAREMKAQGYEVDRVPFMTGVRTTWRLPYLTYNNSVQENYTNEQGKHVMRVFLPTYGCEPLDKMAIAKYQSLGYEVVPLKMAAVSILEGAIRCTSYPLQRTNVPYQREQPAAQK